MNDKGGSKERMLTMIQRYHIKHQSFHKGQSLRSIAEETGHDFRTVKKYAEEDDYNLSVKPKRGRPSKLDPVKPLLIHGLPRILTGQLSSATQQFVFMNV